MLLANLVVFAQKTTSGNKDNLLFLVRQPEHISQAVKTIESMQKGAVSNLKLGNVVIIVCGEAVVDLTTKLAEPWLDKIKRIENVSIMACGLSLQKFQKNEADLIPGVQFTENGFIKAFELQKAGYLSVEL